MIDEALQNLMNLFGRLKDLFITNVNFFIPIKFQNKQGGVLRL